MESSPAAHLAPMALDPWDVRHLLLSVGTEVRPERDAADLDAVLRRVVEVLEARPMPVPRGIAHDLVGDAIVEAVRLWAFETNAWIYAPRGAGGPCVVVDAPPRCEPLLARIAELDLDVAAVVLTHGHLDHAGGVG